MTTRPNITADHDRALSYHPLVGGRGDLHEALRQAAKDYADELDRILPGSREASLAFTDLQASLMWANAALAIHYDGTGDPIKPGTTNARVAE